MKRRHYLILSLSLLLMIGLIATLIFFYHRSHHLQIYPFADLSNEDIVSVGVCADLGSPAVTHTLSPNEHAALLSILQGIQTAAVASPEPPPMAGGTTHMFVFTLQNGEEIHVAARKPFLLYNGQYFRADADSLTLLSDLYMTQAIAWLEDHT